jgi:hypothetical protein
VNGAQVATQAVSGGIINSNWPLRIGGNNVWREYFKGRIDEVRIYNGALTAGEIQADMNIAIGVTTGGVQSVQNLGAPLKLTGSLPALGNATRHLSSPGPQTADGGSTSNASTTGNATAELLTLDRIEVGEVVVDHQWKHVDLRKLFTDPIVVAKALSDRDSAPTVVKVRQTDATGFELRLQPWDESSRLPAPAMVSYLVVERGHFRLADGTSLESGTVDIDPAYPAQSIAFSQPFLGAPVVMTALTNAQEPMAVTGRPTQISERGFQFQLQPQGLSHNLDLL